jgi:hypothetical protein
MVIRNKYEAIAAIKCVQQDFRSLKDGEWVPDEDSCDASVTVLQAVLEWLDMPKATPIPWPDCFKV